MRARFRSLYGGAPSAWVRAPGRAELLGTDTDDHLGYVMTMAIPLDTWIAFRPSGSSRTRVYSMNVDKGTEYLIGREPAEPAATWERYVNGVSRVLGLKGYTPAGVDAVLHSTVPIGGGLSSSASLEVAAALMFQSASGFALSPRETAETCQQAENQCVGVMCGILDQYSSVFGKEGTALLLDCRSLTHVEVRIPSDIRIVICDTNFPRTLAGSEYARRRQECDEGTRLLQEQAPEIRTLCDVTSPLFERLKGALPDVLRRRCQFVFEENQRVVAFMAAMVRDDRAAMRNLCAQSFFGERDLYEKTVPAMERMFEAMTSGPGIVAARQSGGGFGGCMIAYVLRDSVETFAAHVRSVYRQKTGIEPAVHVTSPSAGAGPLES
ncbi:MAG: galactokinase [Spirochaetia bacterium]|jgi:galactokinase